MTKTDLFNKALRLIGHDRSIGTGVTTTPEYLRCESEWDGARVTVLTYHPWNWMLLETPLVQGAEATDDVTNAIEYTYDRPNCIRLVAVMDGNRRKVPFRSTNGIITTSSDECIFQYLEDPTITTDLPDEWPQIIIDAIAAELASRVALAMSANAKLVQAMKQLAMGYLIQAVNQDASEQMTSGSAGDKYIASRR